MTVPPTEHLNFASDNAGPVHPAIMQAIHEANHGHAMGYGADAWTARAEAAVRQTFEAPDAVVRLVPTGIAANALALSCLIAPWQRVFCSDLAHLERDEAGALTQASGGGDLALVRAPEGRMSATDLAERINSEPPERRGAVSLTQATEAGTLYRLEEIAALAEVARSQGMPLHIDGARWSNAVVALGCTPADMTWRAGVDILSLGATKAGLMGAEAVVAFRPELARDIDTRRLRMGLSLSKQRFLGTQIAAWLETGLWQDLARSANTAAGRLSQGVASQARATLESPTEANIVFARFPRATHRRLIAAGAQYYLPETFDNRLTEGPDDEAVAARLVCDWSANAARVDRFLASMTDPEEIASAP